MSGKKRAGAEAQKKERTAGLIVRHGRSANHDLSNMIASSSVNYNLPLH